jgi:hypothetical protein
LEKWNTPLVKRFGPGWNRAKKTDRSQDEDGHSCHRKQQEVRALYLSPLNKWDEETAQKDDDPRMNPSNHSSSPRFLLIIIFILYDEITHPFGDEDQKHATEQPEDGEKF